MSGERRDDTVSEGLSWDVQMQEVDKLVKIATEIKVQPLQPQIHLLNESRNTHLLRHISPSQQIGW